MRRSAPLLLLLLSACSSPSIWQRSLTKGPDAALALTSGVIPTLRTVPWERVESTMREIDRRITTSNVHPDDWTPEQKHETKAYLLRGLQVSQPAESVRILGSSQFRTTDPLNDATRELSAIASKLGADMVVWSSRVVGKADRVEQHMGSASTWGTGWYRDNAGNTRPDSYHEHSTLWIPVRMSVDETAAIAYFLRIQP
jgi:hypothetical protein